MKSKINIADLIDNDPDDEMPDAPAPSREGLNVNVPLSLLAELGRIGGRGGRNATILAILLLLQARLERKSRGLVLRTSLIEAVGMDKFGAYHARETLRRAGWIILESRGAGRRPLISLSGPLGRAWKE